MEREYIRIKRPSLPFPKNTDYLKTLDDEYWKNWVFYYLLDFYKNYDCADLKSKIEEEKKNKPARIERVIAKFLRKKLNENRDFDSHFTAIGENTNDEDVEGNYDVTIHSTNWKNKNFHFECKNLDGTKEYIDKYVCHHQGKGVYDGGVLRYFNGKYAQNLTFGGMIGFILDGDSNNIKTEILKKLNEKFLISPEGDLISTKDNSIEENPFTFDSLHSRQNTEFTIHHLLFDFAK
ncbi:hypothetical protein G5B10_05155 [Fluviicola sp. SGL-29]|nr:hypothetical protein [Fluviicola sp. SGL-29]